MTATDKPRQPAGSPAGGQFSPNPHAEADQVDLTAAPSNEVVIDPASPVPLRHLWDISGDPLVGDRLAAALVARTGLDRALGDGAGRWEDLRCFAAACKATGLDLTDEHAGAIVRAVDQANTGAVHALVAVADGWRSAARLVDRLLPDERTAFGDNLVEDPSWRPGNYTADGDPNHPHAVDRLLAEYDQWQVRRTRLHAEADEGEGGYEELDDLDFQMNWISGELASRLRRVTRR